MKSKGVFFLALSLLLVASLVVIGGCASTAEPAAGKSPIIIAYVGNASSPGTKPCMDMQLMAIEEINAAGGVLGRPIKYVIQDAKGETGLSVAATQRAVMGDKATIVFSEGRSEVALA